MHSRWNIGVPLVELFGESPQGVRAEAFCIFELLSNSGESVSYDTTVIIFELSRELSGKRVDDAYAVTENRDRYLRPKHQDALPVP
jgi:hypothetical protein